MDECHPVCAEISGDGSLSPLGGLFESHRVVFKASSLHAECRGGDCAPVLAVAQVSWGLGGTAGGIRTFSTPFTNIVTLE